MHGEAKSAQQRRGTRNAMACVCWWGGRSEQACQPGQVCVRAQHADQVTVGHVERELGLEPLGALAKQGSTKVGWSAR